MKQFLARVVEVAVFGGAGIMCAFAMYVAARAVVILLAGAA